MMKLSIFAVFVLVILSLQGVLAISTNLRDKYSVGETMIIEISGNIIEPVMLANVQFQRAGHISVPFEYDVKKLGDKYYIWAIPPKGENNYTLIINDVVATVSGVVQKVDYLKNFSVSGNLTSYTVKPGFVLTDKDFEMRVILNEDSNRDISVNFLGRKTITLKPGANTILFSIKDVKSTQSIELIVGEYKIPAYVRVNSTGTTTPSDVSNTSGSSDDKENNKIENFTEYYENITEKGIVQYSCQQLKGAICAENENCTGDSLRSLNGPCCVSGECSSGGSLAWLGWMLAALVIIGGIFVYLKYYKTKGEKNPLQKRVAAIEKKTKL